MLQEEIDDIFKEHINGFDIANVISVVGYGREGIDHNTAWHRVSKYEEIST